LWATQGWRESSLGWGVEVEIGGETVLGSDVDVGSRLVGFVQAGLPFLGVEEISGSNTKNGEEIAGGARVDDATGDGFGELRERGVNRVHGFEGRKVESETLSAGTGLSRAKTAGTITKVVDAVTLSLDGE
jgi:hypothetical protein